MLALRYPLVLASASPRRQEILNMVRLEFEVMPSQFEELSHSDVLSDPAAFAQEMAEGKGKEVFERTNQQNIVLSADTIGILGDHVLEKPQDRKDAKRMLKEMSGRTHQVLTAIALFYPDAGKMATESVITEVTFKTLTEGEIESYLDVEEYADKAAAYAIQGHASVFVEKINGDYFNVVGLPIQTVYQMLKDNGLLA